MTKKQNENLRNELQRLIDSLGIRFGELNIEVLIDKEDKPHFLEVGPRAGGNMIPIQLSDMYSIDLIQANILAAMGEKVDLKPIEPKDYFMTFVVHSHEDGVFGGIEYSADIEPYIYRKCIYKKEGDKVEAFDGAGKAIGIIFMKFPNVEKMNEIENKMDSCIKVKLKNTPPHQVVECQHIAWSLVERKEAA